METIIKALKKLGLGQHDMAVVASTMEGNPAPCETRKMARRMDGRIVDGMRVKVESVGRKVFISLHNAERIHGGAGQSNQPETPTPLDDASC